MLAGSGYGNSASLGALPPADAAPAGGGQPQGPYYGVSREPAMRDASSLARIAPEPQTARPTLHPSGEIALSHEKDLAARNLAAEPRTINAAAALSGTALSPGIGFDGIKDSESFCGCLPPDGAVAAGPNHLIGAVDTAFKVWTKDGVLLLGPVSLSSLFSANTSCLSSISHPFADYDVAAGRFILGALTYTSNNTSVICVAVTQTSDPTAA